MCRRSPPLDATVKKIKIPRSGTTEDLIRLPAENPIKANPASGMQRDAARLKNVWFSSRAKDPVVIVRFAVASPFESKITEFELREHVGEPAWAGCTEQDSATGFVKRFNR